MRDFATAVFAYAFLCIGAAAEPMSAGDRDEATRLLLANWGAEKMIAASVQTGDADELERQQFALSREIGKTPSGAGSRGSEHCYFATSLLISTAISLRPIMTGGLTADRLIGLRYWYKTWLDSITKCEASVGMKGDRTLVLDLGR